MSRKRRQRSTAIRKRVEKKQREQAKAAKRKAKAARAAGELGGIVRMRLRRAAASGAVAQIAAFEERLSEKGAIRGWSLDDLAQDWGLSWLRALLEEALRADPGDLLEVELPEVAKTELTDRLSVLDPAAPGLGIEWDEGLAEVAAAVRTAELLVEEDEEEDGAEG
ncbi:MAG: hypothetical protein D6731_21790 [Planctomycetota bacterium]|nr:MAG: hypothetical protein D6731_21790 [Planctomycetota bacterium]